MNINPLDPDRQPDSLGKGWNFKSNDDSMRGRWISNLPGTFFGVRWFRSGIRVQ